MNDSRARQHHRGDRPPPSMVSSAKARARDPDVVGVDREFPPVEFPYLDRIEWRKVIMILSRRESDVAERPTCVLRSRGMHQLAQHAVLDMDSASAEIRW